MMQIDLKEIERRNPGIDWDFVEKAEAFASEMEAAGVGVEQRGYSLDPPFSGGPTEQQRQHGRLLNLSAKR